MISTTHAQQQQQGAVHSRLERAKGYIHNNGPTLTSSLTPPPDHPADGRDVTGIAMNSSVVVSPPRDASTTELIDQEESTEDVAHLLTIVADLAAREAPLPVPDSSDDDVFGGRLQQYQHQHQPPPTTTASGVAGTGQPPRIRAVSMASPDLRPRPPPSTPIGYSLTSSQRIPPSPAMANGFRPPIRRHGAPIQERSYDDEGVHRQGHQGQQPAYSYSSSSSSSDEGGQYLWSATAGPREQRQAHMSSSWTSTPPKKKKKKKTTTTTTTSRHRHRSAPPTATVAATATAVAAAAPRRPANAPRKRQSRPTSGGGGGGSSRKVLHKKFSWKNYPEVS